MIDRKILNRRIDDKLNGVATGETARLVVEVDHGTLAADVTHDAKVGWTLTEMAFVPHAEPRRHLTTADLNRLASSLSTRLDYVLEGVGLVELDSQQGIAQVRSNPPERDGDACRYFELILRSSGDLTLSRWEQVKDARRKFIPAQVTPRDLKSLFWDITHVLESTT